MTLSLDEIERRYLRYLLTTGKTKSTIANYRRFFVNLRDFADQCELAINTDQLDTELVREFHHWLVTSPLKQPYRGSLQRSSRRNLPADGADQTPVRLAPWGLKVRHARHH